MLSAGPIGLPAQASRGVGLELDSAWLVESPALTLATALTYSKEDLGQRLIRAAASGFAASSSNPDNRN